MKVELKLAALLGLLILLAGFTAGAVLENWSRSMQWLLQAGVVWLFVLQQTQIRLHLNRPSPTEPHYKTFGWANRLTLLRGGLIALTGGFLFQPQHAGIFAWLPGVFYLVAAILDRIDGLVARRTGQTSLLGCELDTVFDALGLLVAPLLAVGYGKIHWSYLLLSLAYYIFQWGLRRRSRRGLAIYPILPSKLRRSLAGFQMGFIAAVLLPLFESQQTQVCGFAFMLFVLLGFVLDWQVAVGRIDGRSPTTLALFAKLTHWSAMLFQPALRLLLPAALFLLCKNSYVFVLPGADTDWSHSLLSGGLLLGATLVLFGIAGRIGALILLLLLSWHYPADHLGLLGYSIIVSVVWLLLLGTGRFSLWQGDDRWVDRQ